MEGSGGGEIEAKEMLASFASRGQPRGWIHYSFKALRVGMVNSPALASRDRSTASGLPLYGVFFVKGLPQGSYPFSSSVSLFDRKPRFLVPTT